MGKRHFSSKDTEGVHIFDDAEPIEFEIDDDEFTAYPPKSSQFAMFIATQSRGRDGSDNTAGIIDFLDGLLDEDDRAVLHRRLLDRTDRLEFGIVKDIVEMVMEEWMDRPTSAAQESSPSPQRTPRKSTAKPRTRA